MARFTVKAFILALMLFFANACDFNKAFVALNSDKDYKFEFNGFEKRLHLNTQKPYALVFFTKDCGVCKEQIKILNSLNQIYSFDFFIILNDASNKEDARLWAENKDLFLPLFYEKRAVNFLSRAVGSIYAVPVIVFVDEKGILGKKFIGLTPQSALSKEILAL